MAPTHNYEQQQINLFIKTFRNGQSEFKKYQSYWSHSFILLSLIRQGSQLQGFYFFSSLLYQGHTNKKLASLDGSCITQQFELFCKILLILFCEHIQHFAKEIGSSYFMSLAIDTQIVRNNTSLTVFINILYLKAQ